MARTPAPEVNITEAIQPVATVHDTYWRPAQPEPSPLHAVARSLASLSDDLSSAFSKMDAEAAHGAKEAGETAYWTGQAPGNTGLPGAEGIPAPSSEAIAQGHRTGVLPLWGSKAARQYEDGYQAAAGLASGAPMQGRIMEKYTALDESVKLNMTPEQFDAWVHNEIRQDPSAATANANRAFAKGIAPQYREVYSKLTDRWVQDRTKDAQIKAANAWGSALTSTLEQSVIEGKSREGGTDYAQVTSNIDAIRQAGFKAGLRQDEIDKQVAASVIQQATDARDANLLTVLSNLKNGNHPLSSEPAVSAAISTATKQIGALKIQDAEQARLKAEREDKLAHDGSLRTITQGMMNDPNYLPDPKDVANVYRRDPTAEATILKTRQSIADGKAFEDPEKIRSLMADIYANPGKGWDILGKGMGDIHTAATMKQVREAVISMETYQQQDSKLFETQSWKRLESFILDAGKPAQAGGSAFREPAQTPATAQALLDAKMAALQWLNTPEGKAANQLQREKFVAGLQKEMFQALQEQAGMDGKAYTRTEGITKALEAGPASEAPTQPGAPQNAPAGSPAAPAGQAPSFMREGTNTTAPAPAIKPWIQELANSPDAPPKWEAMKIGAEYRKDVEDLARKIGKDPQWVIDQAWQRLKGNIDAARRGTGQPAPQPQAAPPVPQAPVPQVPGKQGSISIPGLGNLDLASIDQGTLQTIAGQIMQRANIGPEGLKVQGLGTVHFTPEGQQPSSAFPVQQASLRSDPSTTLAMAATQEGLDLGARFRTLAADPAGDTITAQNGGPTVGSGLQQVSQRRVAQINATPSGAIIDRVARSAGFDPDVAKAIASIESSGRPGAVTGSYKGLFQLSNAEFERFGPKDGRDIMDPEANTIAGINSIKHKMAVFAKEFGRQPSPTELYLMHQQGEAGLRSHAGNPTGLAWENMLNTGEGRQKGERWAKLAVWGNVPSDMRAQFGSVDNITSAQFIAVWITKLQGVPYQQALALVQSGGSRMAAAKPKGQEI